ncbi:SdrD B-like domain-containing protein [Taibaiella koreensis]|uniref:SdrD B-like domain-containing protein n=1 Tax=Taibaiella koreensis TaxID=1268548 RepID=UPI000E59A679|nr:SdrD B-like domain-containing protein [Taibaiella koreensis]
MRKILCSALAGLLVGAVQTSAHRIEYYTANGCIVPGQLLKIDAKVVSAPSSTRYNWQYKTATGSWTCFTNNTNNTINGTAFYVTNASGVGADDAPELTIASPTSALDNVQLRCLMRENAGPCNAPLGSTYGGDDLNPNEAKILRLRYNPVTGACSIACEDNMLSSTNGFYGGFEAVTYENNGSYTDKNFLSGAGSSDLTAYGSGNGSYQSKNNPFAAYGFNDARFAPHSGNYQMVVKGNTSASAKVWYKTMAVLPGEVYSFSVWVSKVDGSTPNIQLRAGNKELAAMQPAATIGQWTQLNGTYGVPPGVTSVTFAISDKAAGSGAHNYVLDDICVVKTADPISIGDKVWFDINRDGRQDASEPGIGGVTVKLFYDGDMNNVADSANAVYTATTNSNGLYSFNGVIPGKYFVQFTLATGYDGFTVQDAPGVPVGENSTANVSTGKTGTHDFTANYLFKDAGMVKNFSISGKAYNDVNGLTDNTVNGVLISALGSAPLYANLYKGTAFVASVPVTAGSYTFSNVPGNTAYTVSISTVAATSGSPASVLAAGWVSTGEFAGTGTGDDGTVDGLLSVNLGTGSVGNVNFGIEQLPTPVGATATSQVNPGGTVSITVPPATFGGTDPSGGTITSLRIPSLPGGATSITVNGTNYTASNFPPAGITVPTGPNGQPTQTITVDPAADGATSVTITFKVTDNAGKESTTTSTATIPFSALSISGKVFNDANGMTNNLVDGTGAGTASGQQLYAYLVSPSGVVSDSIPVPANGSFILDNASANTNYTVVVTTTQAQIGSSNPALTLPSGWVRTGEQLGTGTGSDGNANGILAVSTGTNNISNALFGIEQLPVAGVATAVSQANPGDTITVAIPPATFVATDAPPGTVTSIKITAMPSNATSFFVNGNKYTTANFPSGGIVIPTGTNGQPTQPVAVDPVSGTVTVGIPFRVNDNANMLSTTTGMANAPVYEVPDLTPVITVAPTTIYGNTNFSARVDVWNLSNVPTSGMIKVFVTKSTLIGYTYNNTLSTIMGTSVQNSAWTIDATSNASYYIFTTNISIEGQGRSSFGLNGLLTPGSTKGQLTNTAIINGGSGGESLITNNTDAEIIRYFPN